MRKVLYVDDNTDDIEAAIRDFADSGIEIKDVKSVEKAFEALKEPYDMIISDILMPGYDGLAFAKKLDAEGINIPLIFTSGVLALSRFSKYQGLKNCIGFILKPVTPEKIKDLCKL